MFPEELTPEYTGMVECGGFTTRPSSIPSSAAMYMTFGKRAFFGYLPKPDDEVYWFDNIPRPFEPERGELASISTINWKQHLLQLHGYLISLDEQPLLLS